MAKKALHCFVAPAVLVVCASCDDRGGTPHHAVLDDARGLSKDKR
jgi:hypothetical protein